MDRAELLRLLSEKERVSGERLAKRLGVTRAAIAKQIDALRREGCEISALPRLGYRLLSVPSPLTERGVRAQLGGHPWAERVSVLQSVDSTNTFLKRAAAKGALHGTAVAADCQTNGRGRRGRSFDSAAGTGLYLSVLLRPHCAPRELMTLTAQTAVAVRRTLLRVCGVSAQIKWVNDLFLGGKKICGILTELTVEAESGTVDCAVIGVGINCTRMEFPEPLREIAGSVLSQAGVVPDRNALAAELIREISALPCAQDESAAPRPMNGEPAVCAGASAPSEPTVRVGSSAPSEPTVRAGSSASTEPAVRAGSAASAPAEPVEAWLEEYRAACFTIGRQVTVQTPAGERTGVAESVGAQAQLIVRLPSGDLLEITSGEAVF